MNLVNIDAMTPAQVASICDHTYLNRDEAFQEKARAEGKSAVRLREDDFRAFLVNTLQSDLEPYAVCVRPEDVDFTRKFLANHGMHNIIASVVGFPNGDAYSTNWKVMETQMAIDDGANEIDMVFRYKAYNQGDILPAFKDVEAIVKAAKFSPVKIILETSELSLESIANISRGLNDSGAAFVKTSTGFSSSGAKCEDLRVMKKEFKYGIKISGGVNTANYKELIGAASGRNDGYVDLSPMRIRIGESSLLKGLVAKASDSRY